MNDIKSNLMQFVLVFLDVSEVKKAKQNEGFYE
jgi:hypothetical protein